MTCCLRTCRPWLCCCCLGNDRPRKGSSSERLIGSDVKLDSNRMGDGVVIVKNGRRICGSGAALANAPLAQNKSYFEAKLQSSGVWGLGVAQKKCNLQKAPLGVDATSWVLRHDGALYHKNEEVGRLSEPPREGDVIGITYDHVELSFFINGRPVNSTFTGIRGSVIPVVYVDDGAIIDMQFNNFFYDPPSGGFQEIMIEKTLM